MTPEGQGFLRMHPVLPCKGPKTRQVVGVIYRFPAAKTPIVQRLPERTVIAPTSETAFGMAQAPVRARRF